MTTSPRPGDYFLDRYLPNESDERREEAREQFRKLALLMAEVGERLARCSPQEVLSPASEIGAILDSASPGPPQ